MQRLFGAITGKPSGTYTVNGKEVSVTRSIGEGGNAEIFLVKATKGKGEKYALKRMSVNRADKEKHVIAQWEFQLNQALPKHPNLVVCDGASSNQLPNGDTEYLLLLEYCSEGTLLEWVQSKETRTLNDILTVFADVLAAVAVFHACQPPIAHRDLKPENVLLSKKGTWKLCDFGSASTDSYVCKTAADRVAVSAILEKNTTPSYRAPEMCDLYRPLPITHQADIWALGVMFYQLLFREQPFPDGSLGIVSGKYHIPENHKWPKEAMDLLARMLAVDPTKRATIIDIQLSVGELMKKQPRIADAWSLPFTSASLAVAAGRSKSPASPMPEHHLTVNGHAQLKEASKSRSRASDNEPPSPNAEGEGKKKKKSTKSKKNAAKDFADDDFEASFPAGETPHASPVAPAGFIAAGGIQWQTESDPPSTNDVVVNEPAGDEGDVAESSGNEADRPRRASLSHSHNESSREASVGPQVIVSAPSSVAPTPKRAFAALAPPPAIASTTRSRDGRKAVASPVVSPPPASTTPTPGSFASDDTEEKKKKKKKDKADKERKEGKEGKEGKEKKKKKKQSTETSQVSAGGFGAPTEFGSSAEFGNEHGGSGEFPASPGFDNASGFDGSSEAWGDEDDNVDDKPTPSKKAGGLFAAKLRGALSSVAGHHDHKREKSKNHSKSKHDANDSQNEDDESFAIRDSAASPSPEPVAPTGVPPPIPPRARPSPITTVPPPPIPPRASPSAPTHPGLAIPTIPKPPKSPKLTRAERKEQHSETPTHRTLVPPSTPPAAPQSPKSPTKSPKSPRSPASKSKTTSSLPPPVRRTDSFGATIDPNDPFGDKQFAEEHAQPATRPISVSMPSAPVTPLASATPPTTFRARKVPDSLTASPAVSPMPTKAQPASESSAATDDWTLTGSEPAGWDEPRRPSAINTESASHPTIRVESAVPTLDPRENDFLQFRYANANSEREEFLLQPPRVWLLSDNTLPLTELEDCVGKATKKDSGVPRSKYARQLVLSSWAHQNDAQQQPAADGSDVASAQGWIGLPGFITALQVRPVTKHPQVAYKALLLMHRLMQQGSPAVLSQLFVSRQFLLNLQTAWTSNTTPSCVTDLVLPYAKYILRRIYFVYQHRQFEGNFSLGFYLSRLQSHAGWPNEWTLPLTPSRDQILALMQCMHEGLALASLVFEQSQHANGEEEVALRQSLLPLLSDDLYGMWLAATFTLNQLCLYTGATCATQLDDEFEQSRTSFTHTAAQVANTLASTPSQTNSSSAAPAAPAQAESHADPAAEEDAIAYSLPTIIAHHRTITDRVNAFFATVSPLPSVAAHRRHPNLPGRVNPFQPTPPAHFPPPSNIPRVGLENPQFVWKYQAQCQSIGSTKRRVISVDEDLVKYQTMILSQQRSQAIPQPDLSPPEPEESDEEEEDNSVNPFASPSHAQQEQYMQNIQPTQAPKRKSSNPFGDSDDDEPSDFSIQPPTNQSQQQSNPLDFFAGLSPAHSTQSQSQPPQQQQHAYQQHHIDQSMNNLSIATNHVSSPSMFSPSPQPPSAHITPVTPSALQSPFSDEIDPADLQINQSLFKNETEEVWSGVYQGHTDVAVKAFADFVYDHAESSFRTELEIVRKLRHPHLVLFMGATTEKRPFSVVTELLETNLFDLLHSSVTQLSWVSWLQIALDVAKAMAFLHATKPVPLVHRSLQSSCVLLDSNYRAKISDFGFATCQKAASKYLLTRSYGWQWRAPEQLTGDDVTEKSDIYAFGVILYEIVTRTIPYVDLQSHDNQSIIQAIIHRQYRAVLSNACPPDFAALVQACWMPTPVLRPSFAQCIEAISTMIKAAKGQL